MKRVIILGANGNIAKEVTDRLLKKEGISLTLFLRNSHRLRNDHLAHIRILEGDVLDYLKLEDALAEQEIVYANLSGDLESMAKNILKAMEANQVKKLIFICSIGMYDLPLRPVLRPYRLAADLIEASNLEYTILRPTWFTNVNEVDFETTRKGEPEKGSVISKKSLAACIVRIIDSPESYKRQNLGVNKPKS